MGVNGLWNIVTPLSKIISLIDLRGKTVAIDLSCWIVDSQNVGPDDGPNKHLRNIFFRTMSLLMNRIHPVFVLDGTAPVLKHDIIRERNQNRKHNKYDDKKGKRGQTQRANGGRGHAFNNVVNECKLMLKLMGLTCIKAHGEAEAMCAYLNQDGVVDGVITQDSDCFLYGAKVIYRNFSVKQRHVVDGILVEGVAEEHSLDRIQSIYNLGRNKMIGMALLCGCDYGPGVPGVGKEGAIKLLRAADEKDILTRLKSWKTDGSIYKLETAVAASKNMSDEMKKLISNELSIRKKCVAIDNFPTQELIDEYIIRRGQVPTTVDKWECPNIPELIKFMEKKLKWKPEYTFPKVFQLLTRWHVEHLSKCPPGASIKTSSILTPKRVISIRKLQSLTYFVIGWKVHEDFKHLCGIEFEEIENNQNKTVLLLSMEPVEHIMQNFPNIANEVASRVRTKLGIQKPLKKSTAVNDDNLEKPPRNCKQRKCKLNDEKDRKIYEFFPEKRRIETNPDNLNLSVNTKNTLAELNGAVNNLFESLCEDDFSTDVEDDDDALDMSLLVQQVCKSGKKDDKKIDSPGAVSVTSTIVANELKVANCDVNVSINNSYNSDSDYDIPYIPLSERIKK